MWTTPWTKARRRRCTTSLKLSPVFFISWSASLYNAASSRMVVGCFGTVNSVHQMYVIMQYKIEVGSFWLYSLFRHNKKRVPSRACLLRTLVSTSCVSGREHLRDAVVDDHDRHIGHSLQLRCGLFVRGPVSPECPVAWPAPVQRGSLPDRGLLASCTRA